MQNEPQIDRSKKNVAVCLFGVHPMESLKGLTVETDHSKSHWINNVIKPNESACNIHFFIHCWTQNPKYQSDLIETFAPKMHIFEKQKIFNKGHLYGNGAPYFQKFIGYHDTTHGEIMYSHLYSTKKSVDIMNSYSIEKNVKFDLVCLARLDLVWLDAIHFDDFDRNKVYTALFADNKRLGVFEKITNSLDHLHRDYVYISRPDLITNISNLYNKLDTQFYVCIYKQTHSVLHLKQRYYAMIGANKLFCSKFIEGKDVVLLRNFNTIKKKSSI